MTSSERRQRYYRLLHEHDSPEERESHRKIAVTADCVMDFFFGLRSLRGYEPLARVGIQTER